MKLPPAPKNRFLRGIYLMTRRYLRHNVGIQSAALAFYLLFMLFPFLIFLSALLGLLQLDTAALLGHLEEILPAQVLQVAGMYLRYVAANPSPRLLVFGLAFSIYFPMRATNSLMRAVRTAYHLGPPDRALIHICKTLLYTVLLILTIALTLTMMTVGDRVLDFAVERFRLPVYAASLWTQLRFPVAAAAGFFAIFALYALAQDRRVPLGDIWPGALAAFAAWMGLSWLYAFYVDNIANYSLLYGSIGTIIVVLIWLYLSSVVLIMGSELNGTLLSLRRERKEPEKK